MAPTTAVVPSFDRNFGGSVVHVCLLLCVSDSDLYLPRSPASFSAPYPQEVNPWSSSTEESLCSSTVEKSERRTQDQDQRCQSGLSAKNSVIFSGGDSSKNDGADQQRLQISDLHLDKIQDRGMYLVTISYGSNAMDQRSGVG